MQFLLYVDLEPQAMQWYFGPNKLAGTFHALIIEFPNN
jgi:hypothetical protein